ncbi:hypothetical protein PFISCL1PPCAC_3730, partial [Pristionchus fissidentatus]
RVMAAAGEERAADLMLKCVEEGRVDVLCSILSQLKAKPDFHDQVDIVCCKEGTLLHRAVAIDSTDFVNALLANGVNPCVQSDGGKTAYQCCKSDAVRNAFVQEVLKAITLANNGRLCQLISSGIPVDSVDSASSKNTLLNWAADFSTVDIVRTLCDSGASVNAANTKGETPLLTAVRRGDEEIVRQLLAAGGDPKAKTAKGEDAFEIATKKGGALLPLLSAETVTRGIRRTASVESMDFDRQSMISCETSTAALFNDRSAEFKSGRPECWTDMLWPQPKLVRVNGAARPFQLPKDNRLKIYFDDSSDGCPRRLMQAIQISAPLLNSAGLEMDYRGHKTADHDREDASLEGRVTVGVWDDARKSGSYCLAIEANGIEITASDYAGVRYAMATLVQVVRLHRYAVKHAQHLQQQNGHSASNGTTAHHGTVQNRSDKCYPYMSVKINLQFHLPGILTTGDIPSMTVRDDPDRTFRAIYQDFSGCRILNTETLLQLATRLSYCKANYLFVNFEVRTTDRYQLPYTNRDLFHMSQVCDELFVTLVPSLDLQSNYIEPLGCRTIIDHFLDDFPLSKAAHFGPNISSILIANRQVLAAVQRRVKRIFLSVEVDEKNASSLSRVPPYVTLCVEGRFPFDVERLLNPRVSLVLRFSTGDDGYLCAAPDSTAKKALLAAKLGEKSTVVGTMVCELSTGCEIVPPSLSYVPLLAAVGVGWNCSVDMRRFAFLLPRITAHHVLLDGDMVALFEQASTLGRVEHQLTRFSCGTWRPGQDAGDFDLASTAAALSVSPSAVAVSPPFLLFAAKRNFATALPYSARYRIHAAPYPSSSLPPISVFVEIILNPENLALDRLTPVIFKKARIELRRSLKALDDARRLLPYNFELALVLAEIKLVTELLVLASRIGQSLCVHGGSYMSNNNGALHEADRKRSDTGIPYSPGRVGVGHLPLAIRTDLANSLLEIRAQFQHVWLSRSIPSTLPNALKIFDNLFKALLPPDLQEFGKQLL